MSPLSMNGPRTPYKCRSEPQIAVEVSRTIASVGCSIFGSGTSSTRTSLVPCQTTAFIAALLPPPPLLLLLAAAAWLGLARLSRGLRGLGHDPARSDLGLVLHRPGDHVVFAGHQRLEALPGHLGRVVLGCLFAQLGALHAGPVEELGVGGAGHQRRDRHAGVPQLITQGFGKRQQE